MRSYEILKDQQGNFRAVRKFHDWGYSEVYMPSFGQCFTVAELQQVVREMSLVESEMTTEEKKVFKELQKKLKEKLL